MVQILALHCNFLTLHDFWSKSQYIKTIRFFHIIVFIIIEIIGLKKFLEFGLLLLDSNCSLELVVERQWFRKLVSDRWILGVHMLYWSLKFSVFLDSFRCLSWWKPLSYWVRTLCEPVTSRKEPRILKPSSNSGLALASITAPATDISH